MDSNKSNNSLLLSAAETLLEIKQNHLNSLHQDSCEQDDRISEYSTDLKTFGNDEEDDEEKQVMNQIQNDENIYQDTGKHLINNKIEKKNNKLIKSS